MERNEKGQNLRIAINDYTVIDLETTGRNINRCEVIEMSAVRVKNGMITEEFSELVKPNGIIPPEITKLTGITNSMVANQRPCNEVLQDFLRFIGDDIVVGHNILTYDTNILYDLSMRYLNKPFCNQMIDTFQFARCCNFIPENYKLITISAFFGIDYDNAHRALADCRATYECYEKMKPLLIDDSLPSPTSSGKTHQKSKATKAINELQDLIREALLDDALDDDEIYGLLDWMADNRLLEGAYPYDIIFSKLDSILEDGVITASEREELLQLLKNQLDPVSNRSESITDSFAGKTVVLTGEFVTASRTEMEKRFQSAGAVVDKNVTKKTDCLIVGGSGSDAWSCGNYGNKVKKALEMQAKGHNIHIIKEIDAIRTMQDSPTMLSTSISAPISSDISNSAPDSISEYDRIVKLIHDTAHEAAIKYNLTDEFFELVTNQKSSSLWLKEPMTKTRSQLILTVEQRGKIGQKYGRLIAKSKAVEKCSLTGFQPYSNNTTLCYYEIKSFTNICVGIIQTLLYDFAENFTPSERFGCCDLYKQCSAARKCLHRDQFYARACWYRKNLESGKIFY